MSLGRLHLLPFSLLSVLVAAVPQEIRFTNSSSTSSATLTGCNRCTVTANEAYHTYPHSFDVDTYTSTNMVVPMVTVHPDGSLETNYVTETQEATAPNPEPTADADPYAILTWEVGGVTLRYPTTYVEFWGLSGGTFYEVPDALPAPTCTYDNAPLELPTNSITSLIVPLPSGITYDPREPTTISAPRPIHNYLNGIEAVSSQFDGTDVASCQWTKIVTSKQTPSLTGAATVQKVSVSILTEVTADQVIITAPAPLQPTPTATPAIAHVEDPATILIVPAPPQNTPNAPNTPNNAPLPQQQGTPAPGTAAQNTPGTSAQNTGGIGGAIAGLFNPAPSGTTNNGAAEPGSGQVAPNTPGADTAVGGTGGAGGTTGGSTASPSSGTASGGQGSVPNNNGGSGSDSAALPPPLVVVLGGTATTITPSVIANPAGTGSVTAFVLGPGSTLMVGGSTVVSGSTISAPAASAATSGGNVGDAIASGIGYTGPLSNGFGSSIRGPNVPIWIVGAIAGVIGAFAFGL